MGSTAFRCVWVVFVVLAVLLPASAAVGAQEPAVQYDPDSPAGREYELPLPSARNGGGTAPAGTSPLFGAGITKRGSGGAEKPSGAASSGDAAKRTPGDATPAPEADAEAEAETEADGGAAAGVGDAGSGGAADLADGGSAVVSQNGLLTGVGTALLVLAIGLTVLVVSRRAGGGYASSVRRR